MLNILKRIRSYQPEIVKLKDNISVMHIFYITLSFTNTE